MQPENKVSQYEEQKIETTIFGRRTWLCLPSARRSEANSLRLLCHFYLCLCHLCSPSLTLHFISGAFSLLLLLAAFATFQFIYPIHKYNFHRIVFVCFSFRRRRWRCFSEYWRMAAAMRSVQSIHHHILWLYFQIFKFIFERCVCSVSVLCLHICFIVSFAFVSLPLCVVTLLVSCSVLFLLLNVAHLRNCHFYHIIIYIAGCYYLHNLDTFYLYLFFFSSLSFLCLYSLTNSLRFDYFGKHSIFASLVSIDCFPNSSKWLFHLLRSTRRWNRLYNSPCDIIIGTVGCIFVCLRRIPSARRIFPFKIFTKYYLLSSKWKSAEVISCWNIERAKNTFYWLSLHQL